MSTFLNNNINNINLEYTPHTKALLEIYSKASDEEIILTNKFLKSEFKRLFQTWKLVDLIFSEYKNSSDYDGHSPLTLADVNLNHTPHTKHLLKHFLSNQYEGTIPLTNQNMKEFLLELHENDQPENNSVERDSLGSLFVQEWISSPGPMEVTKKPSVMDNMENKGNSIPEFRSKIQLVSDFDNLRFYSSRLMNVKFSQARKNYKFLSLNQEKNDIVLTNELPTDVYVSLGKNLTETYREIEGNIKRLEEEITDSLRSFLKNQGLFLSSQWRLTIDED